MGEILEFKCTMCGAPVKMSWFEFHNRYEKEGRTDILCPECNRKELKRLLDANPALKKAFKEAIEDIMGTEEKRQQLADEICEVINPVIDAWNKAQKAKEAW